MCLLPSSQPEGARQYAQLLAATQLQLTGACQLRKGAAQLQGDSLRGTHMHSHGILHCSAAIPLHSAPRANTTACTQALCLMLDSVTN